MHVVGTAGHVDHGKSSLVRALTGTDPDRWLEERLRGMTLDLGFAHLRFEDGVEAGIVDVPGHERFLHNMLAGAAGMEILMLAVAANEGARPQTLEHLAILQYLNVKQTIVVLTKSDLVEAAELAFVEELVREELAGTFAAGAPCIAVSTLTGAGLESLRGALHAALVALPPRAPDAPAYLPVDRVFALSGHGTIVTGTLMQGRIATGDRLVLTPPAREVRVRGLHVFGKKRDAVTGGSRVAVNLPGVETGDIARGAVLASAQFGPHTSAAVTFRPLPAALQSLRRRMPVRAYIGAAEILGTLVFETLPVTAGSLPATLFFREAVVVVPGAAFVVRRLSPKTLLGGGTLVSPDGHAAPEAGASSDAATSEPPEVVAVRGALVNAGLAGTNAVRAGAAANVRADIAETILAALVEDGRALRIAKPAAFVDSALASATLAHASERLAASERATPWLAGVTGLALARALESDEASLVRVLTAAVDDGRLAYRDGYFATVDFVPELTPEQRAFFDGVFARGSFGYAPVPFEDVRLALRASKIAGIVQAFDMLLATRVFVKVDDAVYRSEQLDDVRAKLERVLRRDKQITMAAFRDLVGTSRKFAVPLLEWFDATGVTIRSGDVRVLRLRASEAAAPLDGVAR